MEKTLSREERLRRSEADQAEEEDDREAYRQKIKQRKPITDDLDRQINEWIAFIDEHASEDDLEDDIRQFIRAVSNELKAYLTFFNAKYKWAVRQKSLYYPTKWMLNDELICGKKDGKKDEKKKPVIKRYPKLFDILNALEARDDNGRWIFLIHPSDILFKEIGFENLPMDAEQGACQLPAAFVGNAAFYDKILPGLGIERHTLQKYLSALNAVGGLQRQKKKTGKFRNESIYFLGYFTEWLMEGTIKYKLNRFLTEKNQRALQEFSLM